jgi:hypothetical protein
MPEPGVCEDGENSERLDSAETDFVGNNILNVIDWRLVGVWRYVINDKTQMKQF